MTDSMNFGPDWIRNLSSEGSTGGGTSSSGTKYQLADYRYGREEMLALFDKNLKPPPSLTNFKSLYSEVTLTPLTLMPATSEEEVTQRSWSTRPTSLIAGGHPRGRGGGLSDRGGRGARGGRGGFTTVGGGFGTVGGRPASYDPAWGGGNGLGGGVEQSDWTSPRKEYGGGLGGRANDNWRRPRTNDDDEIGWRGAGSRGGPPPHEKWGRSTSWRGGDGDPSSDDRPLERGGLSARWSSNSDGGRGFGAPPGRSRTFDHAPSDERLPEWASDAAPAEGGGSFDERGAFHGSDNEELDRHSPPKREGLQKSTSQQHITNRAHPPLLTSKSTTSLPTTEEDTQKHITGSTERTNDDLKNNLNVENEKVAPPVQVSEKIDKEERHNTERSKTDNHSHIQEEEQDMSKCNGPTSNTERMEESDFEKLQEDFVSKLVVDEEPPKHQQNLPNFEMGGLQPPPNLTQPVPDQWFYQDPQGQMQGPFSNVEMSEWYKAGYFSHQLKVRRQCDERFFLLGELIAMCGDANPFQAAFRAPVLRNDVTKMAADPAVLQFRYMSQMAAYKQAQARIVADPWSALTLQQQQVDAQRLIVQHQQQQQQQQLPQDLQFMQQQPNPLMQMINQMQQANKLPSQNLVDKPPQNITGSLDPHMHMHMSNLLMQNRLPGELPNHLPPTSVNPEGLPSTLPGLQTNMQGLQANTPGLQANMSGLHGNTTGLQTSSNPGMPANMSGLPPSGEDSDLIMNLLKQWQQKQQQETLWLQKCMSGGAGSPAGNPPQQWPSQQSQNEVPLSMWDMQQTSQPTLPTSIPETVSAPLPDNQHQQSQQQEKPQKPEKDREQQKEETKELKKKKDLEEKQAKKDLEERRKQEQRKQELEKKAAEERKKKEEDKIRKELEKAKREAEEKRMRELEEKRRLKEQRKIEEENRKRMEETRKQEEERLQREQEERAMEEHQRAEERRQEQIRLAKAAPWSQSNSTLGMSLAEIQKAEREKRAQEAALQIQRAQIEKEFQQHQQQQEKPGGLHLSWANRPMEPKKVKSLAEIQAEEQERLAKEAAEARLRKEKEARDAPPVATPVGIWSGQSLTWASAPVVNMRPPHQPTQSQATPSAGGGFWDDHQVAQPQHRQLQSAGVGKPSTAATKANTVSSNTKQQQQPQLKQQPAKIKKKEEQKTNHNNNNNGPQMDEFTSWCYKTLGSMSANVDIPTFVTFLREVESALDVRDYCCEYLGEGAAAGRFAAQFVERRREGRQQQRAPRHDDMCAPAPALTPAFAAAGGQSAAERAALEFQEVKGKNKKNKKSKMMKVDSRILGFNVTSAPDRINVGDRDYGDNS